MTPYAYATRAHRKVNGWLRPEAAVLITALSDAQAEHGAVGEIGVHHGKLFLLLNLLRRKGEGAVALDLFERQDLNVDGSGHGDRRVFERNLQTFSPDLAVVIRSVDSTTVTAEDLLLWGGTNYRLFSVDGGHTAAITESDLRLAAAVIAPGGLIILDDYFNVAWPGVSEGANRFLMNQSSLVAVGSAHGKTFFSYPSAAPDFRAVMRSAAVKNDWHHSEQLFHGEPHVICAVRSSSRVRKLAKRAAGGAVARVMARGGR